MKKEGRKTNVMQNERVKNRKTRAHKKEKEEAEAMRERIE